MKLFLLAIRRAAGLQFAVLLALGAASVDLRAAASLQRGDILVIDPFAAVGPAVLRVDPVSGEQSVIAAAGLLSAPTALAFERTGTILVCDTRAASGEAAIIRINPLTGIQTLLSSGRLLNEPHGLVVDRNGRIFVVDAHAFGGPGGVIGIHPVTGDQEHVSSAGYFDNPMTVCLDALGGLLVCDPGALSGGARGGIIRVDPESGLQTPVSLGGKFRLPCGVAMAADGSYLVAEAAAFGAPFSDGPGGLVAINSTNGDQTVVSSGGVFVDPFGLAVESSGSILVADLNAFDYAGGIVRIDPISGAQTVLSAGGLFGDPCGVVVVRESPDSDGDGVPDERDLGPNTPAGSVVDATGRSLEQICPCRGPASRPWKSHGEYVKQMRLASAAFVQARLITPRQQVAIMKQAVRSDCGKTGGRGN